MIRAAQKVDADDPRADALRRRCADIGLNPSQANLVRVASQMAGLPTGKALILGVTDPDLARKAFDAVEGYRAARERYQRIALGLSMYPAAPKMEMEPEPFEVDDAAQTDDRTPEEKERDARNSMAFWDGCYQKLSLADRSHIDGVLFGWADVVQNGKLTPRGSEFVAAAIKFEEIVDRACE